MRGWNLVEPDVQQPGEQEFRLSDRWRRRPGQYTASGCRSRWHHWTNRKWSTMPFLLCAFCGDILLMRLVQSSVLRGSESWSVRKKNEVALQHAEMRIIWWICDVNVKDRVQNKERWERLCVEDVISVLQQNRLDYIAMCCENKIMIGWRNVWSMMTRVPAHR